MPPLETPTYRKPTGPRILSGAKALYDLEDQRNQAIRACAAEQGKILGFDRSQFWTHSLPEQLFALLDSFDNRASEDAAIAFLERQGYSVTKEE